MKAVAEMEAMPNRYRGLHGSVFWQSQFESGHVVKIMAPQNVRPFVCRQNDSNDAGAMCTALQQLNMRFSPKKTLEQQDIQASHRPRQRLVNHCTALISHLRGLLLDRGIAISPAHSTDPFWTHEELTDLVREIVGSLYAFMLQIDQHIRAFDKQIDAIFKGSEACQRIAKMSGVGPKTATAMIAAIGNCSDFQNGRHRSACGR
jgi:transposase